MAKQKKADETVGGARVPGILAHAVLARLQDEEGQITLPVLWECLIPQYEADKLLRPAGKLTVTVEGAYWRLQLDLPYERLTCRMFGASLASALSDMNAYLATGKAVFSPMFEKNKKPLPRLPAQVQ